MGDSLILAKFDCMSEQNKPFTYYAFICYKSEDDKWADKLQHKIEKYQFPPQVVLSHPELPERIKPIYRDKTDLGGGNLSEKIKKGLNSSRFLIVICSPCAAKSEWVEKEVQYFIDAGRTEDIIPFIIEGDPYSNNPEKRCFPRPLAELKEQDKGRKDKRERIGIRINDLGEEAAICKVIATLFPESNLDVRSLWDGYRAQEEAEQRKLRIAQSRLNAEHSQVLCHEGDFIAAQRLALAALPTDLSNPKRPYTAEAERALRRAAMNSSTILKLSSPVRYAAFSQDDSHIATFSGNDVVTVWETATGKKEFLLSGHPLPDGNLVTIFIEGGDVRITPVNYFETNDRNSRFSIGRNGVVEVRRKDRRWKAHTYDHIVSGVFDYLQRFLLYGNDENEIKLWKVGSSFQPAVVNKHEDVILAVGFNQIKNAFVSISQDGTVCVYSGQDYEYIKEFPLHLNLSMASVAPCGIALLIGEDGTLRYFDTETGATSVIQRITPFIVNSVQACSSPFYPLFVLACKDKKARVVEVGAVLIIPDSVRLGCCATFTPDGEQIVSTYYGDLRFWSVFDGHMIRHVPITDRGVVTHIKYLPGGRAVETAHSDGSGARWDIGQDRQSWSRIPGHFSAEQIRQGIVSARDEDRNRIYWMHLKNLPSPLKTGTISSDGRFAATADDGQTVQIWDVKSRQCVFQATAPFETVDDMSFNPQGNKLMVVNKDNGIAVFSFPPLKELMDAMRMRLSNYPWSENMD